ncbi:MAG: hypothetical protein ACK4HW_02090 [Roseinatronobacter sp.]
MIANQPNKPAEENIAGCPRNSADSTNPARIKPSSGNIQDELDGCITIRTLDASESVAATLPKVSRKTISVSVRFARDIAMTGKGCAIQGPRSPDLVRSAYFR